jgi:hypothetical protein
MKPDWEDAPEWANWLARDADGELCWFENEPQLRGEVWGRVSGRCRPALYRGPEKFRRPQTTKPAEAGSEGQGA